MKIGLIGAGNIGGALAKLAVDHGHTVTVSNSRGPDTLAELVASLGDNASAGTTEEAATEGDLVVVTIPLKAISAVPVEPLVGKVVIDTNNYYPERDGQIDVLDNDSTTTAELLQALLPASYIVKAFNHISASDLASQGTPSGTPDRRALAISGEDAAAKKVVSSLIDEFGFDVVDAGPLAEGRSFQKDTPAYGPRFDEAGMRAALAAFEAPGS